MNVYINDVYMPYLNAKQHIQVFYGGSSSGKSFFLAQRAVLDNLSGTNYLIVRNVAKTIRHSCFNEIKKTIYAMGVGHLYKINESDMVITCKLNNKQILFAGLDNVEKLKSITPVNGVIETIHIEEATETKREAYKQLTKRLRGISDKPKRIVLSFNPILREHWIYEELFKDCWQDDKTLYKDDDKLIVKTTYKDNKFLTEDDRRLLENETDPYFYQVYTLGNFGVLGNVIFKNWRVEDLTERKKSFDNIYNGLDFGYTNPNAFVRFHIDEANKKIYILEELYKREQTYESLARDLKHIIGNEYITCDHEDKRGIDSLVQAGLRAIPAKKGPDSVLFGIQWLQQFEIVVDVNCQNFKNEIQSYHWQEDKDGNVVEKPVKKDDHLLDALRYGAEMIMLRSKASAGRRL